jgi:DNA invertase Pin-like site-specific DNA recombinase
LNQTRRTATPYSRVSNPEQARGDAEDRRERGPRDPGGRLDRTGARRTAISYSRFSNPKQAKGDSEDRQERNFRAFCERHNLTPLPEVYADRGRSGYKDEHRKKGKLGELIAAAKDGRFEPGTVIVVEAWDRLGRLRPDRQTELVAELLRTGVHIGICRLDDTFTEDDFGTHKWTTLAVFIQLAYQESKQKAERVAASWQKRREKVRAKGGLLTSRLPAWLEYVNGVARPIPERVAAVRRIFELAANGYGHKRIIATLEKEKVPAFGEVVVREGRRRSQFSGKWTRPYVGLILNDERATGAFQPKKADGLPDGKPLAGYYPTVVTKEAFLLARAAQQTRRRGPKEREPKEPGLRQRKYVNVFRSVLRHARDGEGFMLHIGGTREQPTLLLRNKRGADGRGRNYTFPYPVFEEAILALLAEVRPESILPPAGQAENRADVLRAKLANIRADRAQIKADLVRKYSRSLSEALVEKDTEEEQTAAELQDELARSVKPAAKLWGELPGLVDLLRTVEDPDAVRLKLRVVLGRTVSEAWAFVVKKGNVQLMPVQFLFTEGARREYLVVYRPAGHSWSAYSFAGSLADVLKVDDLDLRRPDDVRALEEELLQEDLDELKAKLKAKLEGGGPRAGRGKAE